ncbi:unnamed protein product [Schistocephalus solidus]|uniref:Uncharacterized protein n=1 Tax=Schistocephalus solidus TaxID=70667 RepID=A0A183STR0_SCHSO|nr:unnamed protein product [Schistocephalus solidus]
MQINPAKLDDLAQNRSVESEDGQQSTKRTGSPPSRPNEWHKIHQHPGPTPPMPKTSQHARAVNTPSTRESVRSDTFGRKATTIRKCQLPHPHSEPLTVTPAMNYPIPTIVGTKSQCSSLRSQLHLTH